MKRRYQCFRCGVQAELYEDYPGQHKACSCGNNLKLIADSKKWKKRKGWQVMTFGKGVDDGR